MALITACQNIEQRVATYVCECVEDCLTSIIYRGCCHVEEVAAYLKESQEVVVAAADTLIKQGQLEIEEETLYPTLKMLQSTMTFRGLDETELAALISGLQA